MKIILSLFLIQIILFSKVIECGDVFVLEDKSENKLALHTFAQKRAQSSAESFMNMKLKFPYGMDITQGALSPNKKGGTFEQLIPIIEVFWCQSASMPLHSAYYNFYMSNKVYWTGEYSYK
jgi:hypothetical protein